MTSRLDRLFVLLEAGAGAATRRAAARQLGEIQKAHPEELHHLLGRLTKHLRSPAWETRVAASQVMAPVRETCAQTLGVALAQLRSERVRRVAALLSALARQPQWEARHGALLGYKYLLAARQDVACESGALEHLISGLGDTAEDVSAVAAGALAPAAAALADARPLALPPVVARLWQLLHDQDDLAAPANSYMALLASLMALPQAAKLLHPIDLTDVLPRLWPYLDHSTSSVRKATLQTLRTLTRPLITTNSLKKNQPNGGNNGDDTSTESKAKSSGNEVSPRKNENNSSESKTKCSESEVNSSDKLSEVNGEVDKYLNWTPELLQEAMRHVYQRVLFEHVHDIQEIAVQPYACHFDVCPRAQAIFYELYLLFYCVNRKWLEKHIKRSGLEHKIKNLQKDHSRHVLKLTSKLVGLTRLEADLLNYYEWKTKNIRPKLRIEVPNLRNIPKIVVSSSHAEHEQASTSSAIQSVKPMENKSIMCQPEMRHKYVQVKPKTAERKIGTTKPLKPMKTLVRGLREGFGKFNEEDFSEDQAPSAAGSTVEFSDTESSVTVCSPKKDWWEDNLF